MPRTAQWRSKFMSGKTFRNKCTHTLSLSLTPISLFLFLRETQSDATRARSQRRGWPLRVKGLPPLEVSTTRLPSLPFALAHVDYLRARCQTRTRFSKRPGTTAVPHNCPPFREGGTAEARAVVGRTAPPRERRRLTLLFGVEPYERGRPCWRGIQESWCTAPSWTPARRRRAAASAYTVRST